MIPIIIITVFNLIILFFAYKTKIGLYAITPEEQWKDVIERFNKNLKAIDDLEKISDYKLGSGHVYI